MSDIAPEARGNPRSSGYARAVDDWYREPASFVNALLDREPFHGTIIDPACGCGTIPACFGRRFRHCIGSDIADRGYYPSFRGDFFQYRGPIDNIVTNPPFNLTQRFVEHGLTVARRKVAIVARLAFLEGQKRRQFFELTPLARVWVSSSRVSMPPGGSAVEAKNGAVAYAWFVFDHMHSGPPTLGWLP